MVRLLLVHHQDVARVTAAVTAVELRWLLLGRPVARLDAASARAAALRVATSAIVSIHLLHLHVVLLLGHLVLHDLLLLAGAVAHLLRIGGPAHTLVAILHGCRRCRLWVVMRLVWLLLWQLHNARGHLVISSWLVGAARIILSSAFAESFGSTDRIDNLR